MWKSKRSILLRGSNAEATERDSQCFPLWANVFGACCTTLYRGRAQCARPALQLCLLPSRAVFDSGPAAYPTDLCIRAGGHCCRPVGLRQGCYPQARNHVQLELSCYSGGASWRDSSASKVACLKRVSMDKCPIAWSNHVHCSACLEIALYHS